MACCTLPEGVFGTIWNNDALLQAKLSCPTSGHPRILAAAWEVQTSFQRFERGAMLWSNQIGWYGQPVIYVLHADGTFQRFNDTYAPDTDPYSGGETPPEGLIEPALGFGKLWRGEPGVRESLGWASGEEMPGAGRFQLFFGGNMIWLSQRQETYVLLEGTYTVLDSRSFTLPTPPPPGDPSALVLGRWTERNLSTAPLPGGLDFTFLPDGRITFDDCSGRYDLHSGNKITINTDGCTPPTLPTAIYEYAFEGGGDTLILSQRFQHQMSGFSSVRWRQEDNDYEIELTGATISVIGKACSGLLHAQAGCTSLIQWTDCTSAQPPLAAAHYTFNYVGSELIMSRQFGKSR